MTPYLSPFLGACAVETGLAPIVAARFTTFAPYAVLANAILVPTMGLWYPAACLGLLFPPAAGVIDRLVLLWLGAVERLWASRPSSDGGDSRPRPGDLRRLLVPPSRREGPGPLPNPSSRHTHWRRGPFPLAGIRAQRLRRDDLRRGAGRRDSPAVSGRRPLDDRCGPVFRDGPAGPGPGGRRADRNAHSDPSRSRPRGRGRGGASHGPPDEPLSPRAPQKRPRLPARARAGRKTRHGRRFHRGESGSGMASWCDRPGAGPAKQPFASTFRRLGGRRVSLRETSRPRGPPLHRHPEAEILKVGHHGSRLLPETELLDAVRRAWPSSRGS